MNRKLTIVAVLMFFFVIGCKTDNPKDKDGNSNVNDDILLEEEIDDEKLNGLCTQMMTYNIRDIVTYGIKNKDLNLDSLEIMNSASILFQSNDNVSLEIDSIQYFLQEVDNEKLLESVYKIESAVIHESLWSHKDLTVKFLDGSGVLQNKVIAYAKEWEKTTPIRFLFVSSGKADITISFKDKGYWSWIGTESLNHSPSMSLTGIQNENDDDFRGTVLHEFGHAIGLIHEHQQPFFRMEWNEPVVINYYTQPPFGWSIQEVKDNIFYKYDFGQHNSVDATQFDSKSIMLYYIPSRFLKNNTRTYSRNNKLSQTDIDLINRKYASMP